MRQTELEKLTEMLNMFSEQAIERYDDGTENDDYTQGYIDALSAVKFALNKGDHKSLFTVEEVENRKALKLY